MSTEQQNPLHAPRQILVYWQATKVVYRYLNLVTHHVFGAVLKLLVLAYFIFAIVLLSLRYAVMPNIDHYKGDAERFATRAIGRSVSIGKIQASWRGLSPNFSASSVVIHDPNGREALTLPTVSATLSWWSLLVLDVRFRSLEISRPDMDIQRDANGHFIVAGIPVDPQNQDVKGANWLFSQREVVIRDGRVRWNDYQRKAPELVLTDVNFVMTNIWQHHQFALKATPPANLATPLDVRAKFDHPFFAKNVSDITQWKGVVYTDLRETDLSAWKAYIDYPVDIQSGNGAVKAWLDFDHARIANFTADLTLSNVSARLRGDLPPLDLVQVSGRISLSESLGTEPAPGSAQSLIAPLLRPRSRAISLTDFSLETKDGLILPTTTISVSNVPEQKNQLEKTEFKAKLLDLQALAALVERLPLQAEYRQKLADFSPRGKLQDFSVTLHGSAPNIAAYNVNGRFVGLALKAQTARAGLPKGPNTEAQAAVPAIPGFENLSGRIDANDRGGSFSLDSTQVKFNVTSFFTDPAMLFDRLKMQASWTFQEKNQLLFNVTEMDFAQHGLTGSLLGKYLMPLSPQPGKSLGLIDLTGNITGFEINKIGQYLPLHTPEQLKEWLTGALLGGTAEDVKIRLKGDPADFPFHTEKSTDRPKGEFSVVGKIKNGSMNYAPGKFGSDGVAPMWPFLEAIQGSISFNRTRMEIKAESGKTHGATVSNVTAIVPDLLSHDRLLQIDGTAAGALQDFVRYTNDSPVAGWIKNFTDETKAKGEATLALKLHLPMMRLLESGVQGTLQFADNEVNLLNILPAMSHVNGKLEFYEKGLNLNGIKAGFLGGPVVVSGGTQRDRDGSILIKATGSATAEGIAKAYAAPAMQRLSEHFAGGTKYSTTISVKKQRTEIVVESNLQGLALDLPAPLHKVANEVLPLRFELATLPSEETIARDELKLSVGSSISGRYLRQKAVAKNAEWRVVRGGIGVNVEAPQPESGLSVNVNMKSLDFDAWKRLASMISGANRQKGVSSLSGTRDITQYVDPDVFAARVTELNVFGNKLGNVVLGASQQRDIWQVNIQSDQVSGYLTWNEQLDKMTAHLASYSIPKSKASEVPDLLGNKNETNQIPALDVVVDNFELSDKKLGRVELAANIVSNAGLREWHIGKLSIVNPDAELKATGKWTNKDGHSESSLLYTLDIANAGKLLERFGSPNTIRGGKGKITGDLNWKGLPYPFDIPSLSGHLTLDLAAGQFLKKDSSELKLLNVLSLHLTDVFSEGFAFDGIVGKATVAQGVATTDSLKMRGASANVLLEGAVDIAKETLNMHVVVVPDVNFGNSAALTALACPACAVAQLLSNLILRNPLSRASTHEYKWEGTWKDAVPIELTGKSRKTSVPESQKAE